MTPLIECLSPHLGVISIPFRVQTGAVREVLEIKNYIPFIFEENPNIGQQIHKIVQSAQILARNFWPSDVDVVEQGCLGTYKLAKQGQEGN